MSSGFLEDFEMMGFTQRMVLVCTLVLLAGPVQLALADSNAVEIDVLAPSFCEQEIIGPGGGPVTVWMTGQVVMHVFFEGPNEGMADDDDMDGRDEVPTEIVELNLSGIAPTNIPVHLHLDTNWPALGQMEETSNITPGTLDVPPFGSGTVDSTFDVNFVVVIDGHVMYTEQSVYWSGTLTEKPPGLSDAYYNSQNVKLVDANGDPTGYTLGTCRYRPTSVVETDILDDSMGELTIVWPNGEGLYVEMEGNSTMHVFFEGDTEGSAYDDDGDLLDDVRTELAELSLTGFYPELGVVRLGLDARAPSHGQMEERTNSTSGLLDVPPFASSGVINSFFDVFFVIEFGGMVMYGDEPLHWTGSFTEKPAGPGEAYEDLRLIGLVDSDGVPTRYSLDNTRYKPTVCGDPGHPYPIGDLNKDCEVNFFDIAILALHWLDCTRPQCY